MTTLNLTIDFKEKFVLMQCIDHTIDAIQNSVTPDNESGANAAIKRLQNLKDRIKKLK